MLLSTMADILNELLRATSRSFYLTLRVLPGAIRPQIGLAYLLARTADTIADTEIVPPEQRLEALQKLRERILGQSTQPLNFGKLVKEQGNDAEKLLLERVEDGLAALQRCSEADQKLIHEVLKTIISGQELDLRRFEASRVVPIEPSAPGGTDTQFIQKIMALETDAQLDDYTYRVAGCVGEFWSRMCRSHLFSHYGLEERQWINDGVRFGKGLQLVNILRDLPADLKKGRCYLPRETLDPAGLQPETLLSTINEAKFLPYYHRYLDVAQAHLEAGWRYTNTLPFGQYRVRLACAWPILIGIETINRLRAADVHQLQRRVKISRGGVKWIILKSLVASPFPFVWRKLLTPRRVVF